MSFYTKRYRKKNYLFIMGNDIHNCARQRLEIGYPKFDVYLKDTFMNRIRARLGCV